MIDLLEYWHDVPPVHVALRGLFGGKSASAGEERRIATPEDLKALVARHGG